MMFLLYFASVVLVFDRRLAVDPIFECYRPHLFIAAPQDTPHNNMSKLLALGAFRVHPGSSFAARGQHMRVIFAAAKFEPLVPL